MAQGAIESAVSSLEKSKSVTNEVYSERRDPKTREIIKSSRMFTFSDEKLAGRLIEAIRKNREKATSFQMNDRRGHAIYNITFDDNKNLHTKYSLVQQSSSRWMLVIEIVRQSRSSRHDRSDFTDDTVFDFDCGFDDSHLTTCTMTSSGSGITVITGLCADGDSYSTCEQRINTARQQAREARRQAKAARKQARAARQQAREARQQAREAQNRVI